LTAESTVQTATPLLEEAQPLGSKRKDGTRQARSRTFFGLLETFKGGHWIQNYHALLGRNPTFWEKEKDGKAGKIKGSPQKLS
jgi:hypothetical protein